MKIPESKFDNERRFIFNNWTNEDFIGLWDSVKTEIKAGAIIELPMYKAFFWTKHLVDREMNKAGKVATDEVARTEMEDRTCTEIGAGVDSPVIASMKEQLRKELEAEMKAKEVVQEADEVAVKKTSKKNKEFEGLEA
jgi:hypothetical protein